MTLISFTVNARSVEIAAHGDTLCDHLSLTYTRFGCASNNADAGLAWC